jgi:hypothetical protein
VKKVTTCILLILFCFVLSVPTIVHANANSANRAAQKNAKKLSKKNARQQKKDQKTAQRATREWKKHHQLGY